MGTREAEGFDEDLDSTEYHDANDTTEETTRKEEAEADASVQRSTGFQGGFGSSSLKECIELLNTTTKIAPAPLDSGVGNSADPQHMYTSLSVSFPLFFPSPPPPNPTHPPTHPHCPAPPLFTLPFFLPRTTTLFSLLSPVSTPGSPSLRLRLQSRSRRQSTITALYHIFAACLACFAGVFDVICGCEIKQDRGTAKLVLHSTREGANKWPHASLCGGQKLEVGVGGECVQRLGGQEG